MLAPRSSASTHVAIVPGSAVGRGRVGEAVDAAPRRPRKRLREVPITSGRPSAASSSRRADQREVVLDGLAEADPGVEQDALLGDPRRHGEGQPLLEEGPHLVDDVAS